MKRPPTIREVSRLHSLFLFSGGVHEESGNIDQIVLITGDSDFVPAAKLARVEGIDFIVDSMGMKINDNLIEHIDGLRSYYTRFEKLEADTKQ